MLLFAAVVLFLVGSPTYLYLRSIITGGVYHHGDVIEVDLKAMSMFEMDQVDGTTEDVPALFRQLDGKRVQLCGEMWAPQSAAGRLSGFDLVYSIGKCCFSGPPKVQHFVKSYMNGGRSVDYYGGQVNVTGILHVGVEKAAGRVQSVYRCEVERVDPS